MPYLVITSPPYNLKNSTGNGMKDGRGGKWRNAALINGYEHYDDRIISSTTANLILDPFLGSGTTAVAANLLSRNYIGIELSPKYCTLSEQRLRETAENFALQQMEWVLCTK